MNEFTVVLPSVRLHKACPDKAGCRNTGPASEPVSPPPAGQWEHAEKEDHQQKRWAIETFPSALISSMQMNQSPSGRVELGPVQCTSVRDSIPPRRGGGPPSPPPCGGFDVLVLRLGRHHCSTYTSTSNPPEGGGKEGPPPLPGRRGRGGVGQTPPSCSSSMYPKIFRSHVRVAPSSWCASMLATCKSPSSKITICANPAAAA